MSVIKKHTMVTILKNIIRKIMRKRSDKTKHANRKTKIAVIWDNLLVVYNRLGCQVTSSFKLY